MVTTVLLEKVLAALSKVVPQITQGDPTDKITELLDAILIPSMLIYRDFQSLAHALPMQYSLPPHHLLIIPFAFFLD
jgi:hypothetical protein